jgi:hypothetical protein
MAHLQRWPLAEIGDGYDDLVHGVDLFLGHADSQATPEMPLCGTLEILAHDGGENDQL